MAWGRWGNDYNGSGCFNGFKRSRQRPDGICFINATMVKNKKNKNQTYSRELVYITGNNQIFKRSLKCNIQKPSKKEIIKIWDINFKVAAFEENCRKSGFEIKNIFYVDSQNIVRRSSQYHSDTIGFIHIERLDR